MKQGISTNRLNIEKQISFSQVKKSLEQIIFYTSHGGCLWIIYFGHSIEITRPTTTTIPPPKSYIVVLTCIRCCILLVDVNTCIVTSEAKPRTSMIQWSKTCFAMTKNSHLKDKMWCYNNFFPLLLLSRIFVQLNKRTILSLFFQNL